MAKTVAIGIQDFEKIVERNCFYIDKTYFIREWWENGDDVTLIARPRRFGKTLTMSMLEHFFSIKYAGQGALFENFDIWKEEKYRDLQGTYPVISLTFANIKERTFEAARAKINFFLAKLYKQNSFLKESGVLDANETAYFDRISKDMDDTDASLAIFQMSEFLNRYYGKRVIILLDEYDTPMQEAYVNGYWDEMAAYIRGLFNASFKTNPYLERAVLTGITRVSKESIFSDLNNMEIVSTTSEKYADVFGFTEAEVFHAMDELGFTEKDEVKRWYDGFIFGKTEDIYNPWSILNFLGKGKLGIYWANTSSNSLVDKLIREGNSDIKQDFENLMQEKSITTSVDEQIVYNQLDYDEGAIWSLLLAAGYLKVLSVDDTKLRQGWGHAQYELTLTNYEVRCMFASMIRGWFSKCSGEDYNKFVSNIKS